jgi:uncharacterized protein with NRDE domain
VLSNTLATLLTHEQLARAVLHQELMSALCDQTVAIDYDLPNTGIGLERERILAPAFIRAPLYGTRVSTIISVANGKLVFEEYTWDCTHQHPVLASQRYFEWEVANTKASKANPKAAI